jgi:Fe-S-cluster containining protein
MENYDLQAFRNKAAATISETKNIFKKLKKVKPKALDQAFKNAHQETFAEIDCLKCANCCKTTGPLFTAADINRLSKHFKLKPAQFIDDYLRVDEDGDYVLQTLPCPFLGADNYCSVYESRPKACRQFPHTDRNKMHQILNLTQKNVAVCPAVFQITRKINQQF